MKKIHIKESSFKDNFNDDLEPMSEYEKGVKDIDISNIDVPDSFKIVNGEIVPNDEDEDDDEFNMYGIGVEDDDNENTIDDDSDSIDSDDDKEDEDDESTQEKDLTFIDDDEEAAKEAKKFIKNKIRSALKPLEELDEFFTRDVYATSFGGEEYKEHSKRISKVYIELIKILRNV